MTSQFKINLALQGGGAFGAFTWGVLDRLLDEENISFNGISGASSGALNAAIFITGLSKGGREGARTALNSFWMEVSHSHANFSFARTAAKMLKSFWPMPNYLMSMAQFRLMIEKHIDCMAIQASGINLFVSATSVRTGAAKIFEGEEVSMEALLASACLPQIFQPIKINDEYYWDGGYSSNPPLWPLAKKCPSDILLVKLSTDEYEAIPKTQEAISNRLMEMSFNAVLMEELRAIKKGSQGLSIFQIALPKEVQNLPIASRLDANPNLILRLKNLGKQAAYNWLRSTKFTQEKMALMQNMV